MTVCRLPPGTSKWNKIEHRLFSHIAVNWRGPPSTGHEVIVDLIAATETQSGLKVKARLDKGNYPTKLNVSDEEMASLCLKPHSFHGDWSYSEFLGLEKAQFGGSAHSAGADVAARIR